MPQLWTKRQVKYHYTTANKLGTTTNFEFADCESLHSLIIVPYVLLIEIYQRILQNIVVLRFHKHESRIVNLKSVKGDEMGFG